MLRNPEPTVKLKDEQTQQLEVFYSRLTNLQTETSIAVAQLKSIKEEIVKATLEKRSHEKLNGELSLQGVTLKKDVSRLTDSVDASHQILATHRREIQDTSVALQAIQDEVNQRSKELSVQEETHSKHSAALSKKAAELADQQRAVKEAHSTLKQAVESVVWLS